MVYKFCCRRNEFLTSYTIYIFAQSVKCDKLMLNHQKTIFNSHVLNFHKF